MRALAAFLLASALAGAAASAPPPSIDLRTDFQLRLQGLGAGAAENAGDVSGDGVPDALVAVPGSPSTVFVVYGRRDAWRARLTLASLRPGEGYRIVRPGPDVSPFPAVDAGDVNGDGVPDALVGYATADGSVGEAYVVFGRRGVVPETIDLTRLTPSDGYRIAGPQGAFAGIAVAAAGDVNGDGVPDALVGAPGPESAAGSVYVVYGRRPAPPQPVRLDSLTPSEGYRVSGAPGDGVGQSLAPAGDVNGDGVPDGLLGAPSASHSFDDSGSVYVVYGQRSATPATIELATTEAWGYRIDGASEFVLAGVDVDDAGDVSGDGRPDALVGAPGQTGAPLGSAYVVFGRPTPPGGPIALRALLPAEGYRIADTEAGSGAGYSIAGLGDLTGDGVPDAIVGAIGARWHDGSGAAYVVYGRRAETDPEVDLADLGPADGYAVGGIPGANTGWAVANAGDVDDNRIDEAWIWAPNYSPAPSAQGGTLLVGLPRPAATPETGRAAVGRTRSVRIVITCSAARGSICEGAARLVRQHRIVASAGFSVRASARVAVGLRLNPGAARLLRRQGRLRLTVRVVATAEPPAPATVRSRPLLLVPRR